MCETLEIKRLILSHNNCLKLSLLCLMLEKVEDVVIKFGGFSVTSVPNDARERMTLEAMDRGTWCLMQVSVLYIIKQFRYSISCIPYTSLSGKSAMNLIK